jgi:type I restriction enzyme S subunit
MQNEVMDYPNDWKVEDLSSVASVNPESLGSGTHPDYEFKYIDISSVETGDIDWDSVSTYIYESAPSRARRVVRPQDVLLSTVRPTLKAHAFADWSKEEGYVCSTGFAVLRAMEELDPYFLRHLVFSNLVTRQLHRLETGSNYPAVPQRDVERVRIPLPPLPEQRHIAEILDAADAAIRETERVIAKLRQVKQGLLHDTLTRGLDAHGHLRDPDVHPEQFKDSPLGRIPRAWSMQAISELGRVVTGTTPPGSADDAWGDALPFITPTEITNDGFVEKAERSISKEGKKYIRPIPEDSVMVVCIGSTLGKVAIAKSACATNQQINSVIVEGHNSIFAYAAIRNNVEQLKKIAGLQAVPIVNKSKFSSVLVPVAPLDEQRRIAAVLDAHDARIRAEEAVLAKRRQVKRGLLDDLLTGRVRV